MCIGPSGRGGRRLRNGHLPPGVDPALGRHLVVAAQTVFEGFVAVLLRGGGSHRGGGGGGPSVTLRDNPLSCLQGRTSAAATGGFRPLWASRCGSRRSCRCQGRGFPPRPLRFEPRGLRRPQPGETCPCAGQQAGTLAAGIRSRAGAGRDKRRERAGLRRHDRSSSARLGAAVFLHLRRR